MSHDTSPAGRAPATVQYSLTFVNNSAQTGNACVFQQDPDIGVPDAMSLAWFTKRAAPTTKVTFRWTIDYDFVWAETGVLAPGVMFNANQMWAADLSTSNKVSFTYEAGAYTFADQGPGMGPGVLYIDEDGTIRPNQTAVGIGMSGAGTFAVQAQPNMKLAFTPHPTYWITFGDYDAGEVLDTSMMTNAAQVAFPPGVYSMRATINQDGTWSIASTSEVNAQ